MHSPAAENTSFLIALNAAAASTVLCFVLKQSAGVWCSSTAAAAVCGRVDCVRAARALSCIKLSSTLMDGQTICTDIYLH
jgi:hypothetical protein